MHIHFMCGRRVGGDGDNTFTYYEFLEDRVHVSFSPAHPLGTYQTSQTATGMKERTNA